jgi:tetratricopeptide (TPR) repeat protein
MLKMKPLSLWFLVALFVINSYGLAFAQSVAAKNHFKVGQSHLQNGRLEEAEKEFKEALKIEGKYSDAIYLLAITHLSMKKFDDAQKELEVVVALEPRFETARLYLATVFLEKKEYEKAKEQLEYVIRVNAGIAQAHYGLGVVYYVQGDLRKSSECWERAIELDKKFAPAHYNLGLALYMKGRPEEARKLLEKAISLKPQNDLYRFSLAWIDYLTDNKKEAMPLFEYVRDAGSGTPIGLVSDGIIKYEAGDIDGAIECAVKAREKEPQFQNSFFLIGMCQEKREEWEEAISSYEEIIKLDANEVTMKERIERMKKMISTEEEQKKNRYCYPAHEEPKKL